MGKNLVTAGLLAAVAFAQAGKPIEIDPSKPQEVIATVDGQPITAGEYQELLMGLDAKMREATKNSGAETLRAIGWLRRMASEAEKRGLHETPLVKHQIELARMQLLSNATIQERELEDAVTPFEQSAYYNKNINLFSAVTVKLIQLPFANETEELQVKRRAGELFAKLKSGAPFVEMVKQYSKHEPSKAKDGDFDDIRMSDQVPQSIKDAVFGLKKDGDFSEPLRMPNGFYVFQRTKLTVEPYEKVKDSIFTEIKQKRNVDWVAKLREGLKIEAVQSPGTSPDRVVAKLDGRPVTQREIDGYLGAMEEKLREGLKNNTAELLRGMGFMERTAAIAIEKQYDQRAPYRKQLEMMRLQALTNALMQVSESQIAVTEPEIQRVYEENKIFVSFAKIKLIYLPTSDGDAKADEAAVKLGDEIYNKLKAGADFAAMVKQYSRDPVTRDKNGDYPPAKITDDIPGEAKRAIWALKPGEFSRPTKLPNGIYIYKLMAWEPMSYASVRDDLVRRYKTLKNQQWLASMRSGVDVKIIDRATPK
jgi:peptidyl-prolyl cis-trans isomerase C